MSRANTAPREIELETTNSQSTSCIRILVAAKLQLPQSTRYCTQQRWPQDVIIRFRVEVTPLLLNSKTEKGYALFFSFFKTQECLYAEKEESFPQRPSESNWRADLPRRMSSWLHYPKYITTGHYRACHDPCTVWEGCSPMWPLNDCVYTWQ